MTGNGLTAKSVNGRVDKMAQVFKDLKQRTQKLERAYARNISANMDEYAALVQSMDTLQINIDAAPSAKQQCTVELAELKDKIVGVKEALDDLEAMLYLNVTAELNNDNKPAFTNDTQRKYALTQAKRANDEYQEVKGQLDKLGLDKARLDAQLREIEDIDKKDMALFRGCVARVQNVTARISL